MGKLGRKKDLIILIGLQILLIIAIGLFGLNNISIITYSLAAFLAIVTLIFGFWLGYLYQRDRESKQKPSD